MKLVGGKTGKRQRHRDFLEKKKRNVCDFLEKEENKIKINEKKKEENLIR